MALAVEESPDVLEPLVLEFHYINGPRQEVQIAEGGAFSVTTHTSQGTLRASGRVGHVVDGSVNINIETYWALRDGGGGGSRFNGPLQLARFRSGMASLPSPVALSSFWIRRGVDPIPTLVEALRRHDANASWAAYRLGELGPAAQAAVSELVQAVKLQDADVPTLKQHEAARLRENSAAALGKIGAAAKDAVPKLLELTKQKPADRLSVAAALALWQIANHPQATSSLVSATEDSNRVVRVKALEALAEIAVESPGVGRKTLVPLEDMDGRIRAAAAYVLWLSERDERAVDVLIEMLEGRLRGYQAAIEPLGKIGYPAAHRATPALAAIALDSHPYWRSTNGKILERVDPGGSASLRYFLEEIRKNDGQRVTEASEVLAQMGLSVLPALQHLLNQEEPAGRRLALSTLGNMGLPAAGLLAETLRHVDPAVRKSAAEELRTVMYDNVGIGNFRYPPEEAGAMERLRSLQAKAAPAVRALVLALQDDVDAVRTAAAFALMDVGPHAIPAVRAALDSDDPRARKSAADIIEQIQESAKNESRSRSRLSRLGARRVVSGPQAICVQGPRKI